MLTFKMLFESVKQVTAVAGRFISWSEKKKEREDQRRFEHGKQEFLMNFVTLARQHRGNALKPTPGTIEFEYCEALTRDGYLDRDIFTGYYILKGPGHMAAYGLYGPPIY
jgi:hypothetical protein